MSVVSLVVCVVVAGVDVIRYDVAPTAAVHDKSPVVVWGLLVTMLVTFVDSVYTAVDVADPPSPLELTDTTVNV